MLGWLSFAAARTSRVKTQPGAERAGPLPPELRQLPDEDAQDFLGQVFGFVTEGRIALEPDANKRCININQPPPRIGVGLGLQALQQAQRGLEQDESPELELKRTVLGVHSVFRVLRIGTRFYSATLPGRADLLAFHSRATEHRLLSRTSRSLPVGSTISATPLSENLISVGRCLRSGEHHCIPS